MRIVHVLDTLDPADGGPPQVAMRQAVALASAGHEVSILHFRPEPDRVAPVRSTIESVPGHDRVRIIEIDRADVRRFAGRGRPGTFDAVRDAEWLQLHQIWHPILRAAARFARERGIPYSVRPAGSLSRWMLAQKRWKKRLGLAIGYRSMIDGAAFLQALNKDESHEISFFRPRSPVEVVPNGIFPEEISPLPERGAFRARHPELAADRFVVSVGRLHYSKGYDILVPAFARALRSVPDLRLVIIGPDGGRRDDLLATARRLGVSDRVHLIGPIYGRIKFEALVDASLFCLPSRHEAFSNAIVEALAAGLPCVVSPSAHFPEIAEHRAGLIVPIEEAAVGAAIVDILGDREGAAAMGLRGRDLAHSFLWPEIATRLATLFGSYAARRGGVPLAAATKASTIESRFQPPAR